MTRGPAKEMTMKIACGVTMSNYIQRDARALTKTVRFACVCHGHERRYDFINKGNLYR